MIAPELLDDTLARLTATWRLTPGEPAGDDDEPAEPVVDEESYEHRRSRRVREVRPRTISVKRITKAEIEAGRMLYPDTYEKPRTRAECIGAPRPCPFVSCAHHLFLDVSEETGSIKLNFPDLEVWELEDSCALDVADRGPLALHEVGAAMNLTRERVRQVEAGIYAQLRGMPATRALAEDVGIDPNGSAAPGDESAVGAEEEDHGDQAS